MRRIFIRTFIFVYIFTASSGSAFANTQTDGVLALSRDVLQSASLGGGSDELGAVVPSGTHTKTGQATVKLQVADASCAIVLANIAIGLAAVSGCLSAYSVIGSIIADKAEKSGDDPKD